MRAKVKVASSSKPHLVSLQEVFARNFGRDDVEGALQWARKWSREMGQHIPEHEIDRSYCYSQRAMAGLISDYLEGYTGKEPESYAQSGKYYFDTKYGPKIYWHM
jgi:hypothetical protein